MSNNAQQMLAEAAIWNKTKNTGSPVLAGYHCVNIENGNVVKLSPIGIKAVGDTVVGLKPGLRLATQADFDPHAAARKAEIAAQAAQKKGA